MTQEIVKITGRIPKEKWDEILKKYHVQSTTMQEQLSNLLLNKLLNEGLRESNVVPKTPCQSPEIKPPMLPLDLHTPPQSSQPAITQDPFDILRTYPPCPHNARQLETNMLVVFCSKNLEPPITDRKVSNFKVDPERCKICIENFERQKAINEAIQEQKRKKDLDYKGEPLTKRYMGE